MVKNYILIPIKLFLKNSQLNTSYPKNSNLVIKNLVSFFLKKKQFNYFLMKEADFSLLLR